MDTELKRDGSGHEKPGIRASLKGKPIAWREKGFFQK